MVKDILLLLEVPENPKGSFGGISDSNRVADVATYIIDGLGPRGSVKNGRALRDHSPDEGISVSNYIDKGGKGEIFVSLIYRLLLDS